MVALMCWTLAAGWVPPMRTHSVSIAAASAALGATQLKQPRGATPRWQKGARGQNRCALSVTGGLAPPSGHHKRGAIVRKGGAGPTRMGSGREGGGGPALMGIGAGVLGIAAAAITTAWAWLGAAVQMPPSPLAPGEKLYCVSYTPFRGTQSPLGPDSPVDPRQIDEDLAQLKQITDCVRTYSVDHGLDQIPELP